MKRYRHQRLRNRFAILAIVALLWSQVLMAGHPACSLAAMALAEIAAPTSAGVECHMQDPSSEAAACTALASRNDQSSDVGRVPPVPALAPTPALGMSSIVTLATRRPPWVEQPPGSWHRPTAHPASLLLI